MGGKESEIWEEMDRDLILMKGNHMKEVSRYKCGYCRKLAVRTKTIEEHEKVCIKNPNGKNCYMCEMAYLADYYPSDELNEIKDQCMCAYFDEVISVNFGSRGNYAPKCSMFHRSNDSYWNRDCDMAEKNLDKYKADEFHENPVSQQL